LVAGDRRYRRIAADLAAIRASGHPLIAQSAFARFGTQTLFLTLSTEARDAVAAGRYRGWDCLNEWYGTISHRGYDAVRAVTVHFSRLYHPRLIEQAYLAHPDVHRAEASAGLGDGDDIELHGEDLDGTLRYVFRGGGGDCASGCVNVHAQAFDVTPSGAVTDLGVRGGPTPPNRAECAVWPTHHCRSVPP